MPVVVMPTGPIADGEAGYADAIRSLLGDNVVQTSEAPREGLRIESLSAHWICGQAQRSSPVR